MTRTVRRSARRLRAAGRVRQPAARWRRARRGRARRQARPTCSLQARSRISLRILSAWARQCRPGRRGQARRRCGPAGRRPPSTWSPNAYACAGGRDIPTVRRRARGRAAAPGAQRLEAAEQRRVAHARQPLVDEHLRRAEDDAAIGIVLHLLGRLVADAHRPHAVEAGEVGGDALVERLIVNDAVDRLQRPLGVDGDGGDVVDVVLHRLRRAEPVQRVDDEEGVAQPAEAVVPVALRAGRLRESTSYARR